MDLPEELLRGIYSYGFEKPSAIQQRAIRPTMMGRDLIAQAQSGTVRVSCCRASPPKLVRVLFATPLARDEESTKNTIFRV